MCPTRPRCRLATRDRRGRRERASPRGAQHRHPRVTWKAHDHRLACPPERQVKGAGAERARGSACQRSVTSPGALVDGSSTSRSLPGCHTSARKGASTCDPSLRLCFPCRRLNGVVPLAVRSGQVRRDQREGRRQHLIRVHPRKLLQPLTPGKVTKLGPLRLGLAAARALMAMFGRVHTRALPGRLRAIAGPARRIP
jgi:hypothetical protein